jgi:hypothetical protein
MNPSSRRRGTPRVSIVFGAALLMAACGGRAQKTVPEAEMRRAAEALAPFKRNLQSALKTALSEGGFENALDVCRVKAPTSPGEVSVRSLRSGPAGSMAERRADRLCRADPCPGPLSHVSWRDRRA